MAAVITNAVSLPEGTLSELARRAGLQLTTRTVEIADVSISVLNAVKGMKLDTTAALSALNRIVTLAAALCDGLLPEFQEPGQGGVILPLNKAALDAAESCVMVTNAKAELCFDLAQLRLLAQNRQPAKPLVAAGGTRH